jgi:hypothetical protein
MCRRLGSDHTELSTTGARCVLRAAVAAGYEFKLAGAVREQGQHWCAAIDNVERALRMIVAVAEIHDASRFSIARNLSQDDLRNLRLSAGDVKRIVKHSVRKQSI